LELAAPPCGVCGHRPNALPPDFLLQQERRPCLPKTLTVRLTTPPHPTG
jgi:hypothetical protein